jgi:hypothetical protein
MNHRPTTNVAGSATTTNRLIKDETAMVSKTPATQTYQQGCTIVAPTTNL